MNWQTIILALLLLKSTWAAEIIGSTKRKRTELKSSFEESFIIKNNQEKPLIIHQVSTSHWKCKVSYDKRPILSNQTSSLNFHCSDLDKGFYNKSARVQTNQGNFTLKVSGQSSFSLHDKNCQNIRLDQNEGSLEKVQVRNQKQVGICYAEVMAQLYDAWRFTHNQETAYQQTSAIELALAFAITHKNGAKFGGDSYFDDTKILKFLLERGGCSQQEIKKNYPNSSNLNFISAINRMFIKYKNSEKIDSELLQRFHLSLDSCANVYNTTPTRELKQSCLGHYLKDYKLTAYLNQQFPLSCATKLKAENRFQIISMNNLFDINNFLSKENAMPISASICSALLKKGKSSLKDCIDANGTPKIDHGVLIAGSRVNPKSEKCEYLIRNSWGDSCFDYSKEWECEKEQGSVWIDGDSLLKATKHYISVE